MLSFSNIYRYLGYKDTRNDENRTIENIPKGQIVKYIKNNDTNINLEVLNPNITIRESFIDNLVKYDYIVNYIPYLSELSEFAVKGKYNYLMDKLTSKVTFLNVLKSINSVALMSSLSNSCKKELELISRSITFCSYLVTSNEVLTAFNLSVKSLPSTAAKVLWNAKYSILGLELGTNLVFKGIDLAKGQGNLSEVPMDYFLRDLYKTVGGAFVPGVGLTWACYKSICSIYAFFSQEYEKQAMNSAILNVLYFMQNAEYSLAFKSIKNLENLLYNYCNTTLRIDSLDNEFIFSVNRFIKNYKLAKAKILMLQDKSDNNNYKNSIKLRLI